MSSMLEQAIVDAKALKEAAAATRIAADAASGMAWGAGQLDREIQDESWWLGPLDETLLLEMDYELRWDTTMKNLGFDLLNTTFSQTGMV